MRSIDLKEERGKGRSHHSRRGYLNAEFSTLTYSCIHNIVTIYGALRVLLSIETYIEYKMLSQVSARHALWAIEQL
jgi:hypothetical protein